MLIDIFSLTNGQIKSALLENPALLDTFIAEARAVSPRSLSEITSVTNTLEAAEKLAAIKNKLATIKSFKARLSYLSGELKHLGSGSGRSVYDTGCGTVLKLALNKRGEAQNEVEADWSKSATGLVAKLIDIPDGEGYPWVETQKADTRTTNGIKRTNKTTAEAIRESFAKTDALFQKATGLTWKQIEEGLRLLGMCMENQRLDQASKERLVALHENEFFCDLAGLIGNYNLVTGDIRRVESWGTTTEGGEEKVVLIDYGLTEQVWKTHYYKH